MARKTLVFPHLLQEVDFFLPVFLEGFAVFLVFRQSDMPFSRTL